MRTLFLDIDGVLHPLGISFEAGDGAIYCDPPHMRFVWTPILMEILAQHPDVQVVCHSTWRRNYSMRELQTMLPADLAVRMVDMTDPDLDRQASIEAYVVDHGIASGHYVILDDDATAFEGTPLQLVLVPSRTGISSAAAQAALSAALRRLL